MSDVYATPLKHIAHTHTNPHYLSENKCTLWCLRQPARQPFKQLWQDPCFALCKPITLQQGYILPFSAGKCWAQIRVNHTQVWGRRGWLKSQNPPTERLSATEKEKKHSLFTHYDLTWNSVPINASALKTNIKYKHHLSKIIRRE